jgi:hypothetical protein
VRGVSTFLDIYFGLGKMCFQDMRGQEDPLMFRLVARDKSGGCLCSPRGLMRRLVLDVLDYYTLECHWTNKRTSSYVQHTKRCQGQETGCLLLLRTSGTDTADPDLIQ